MLLEQRQAEGTSTVLDRGEWSGMQRRHSHRVTALTGNHVARRARGEKHPVYDFLFEYYSFRVSKLHEWHPGPGVMLLDADEFLDRGIYTRGRDGVAVDTASVPPHRRQSLRWILDFLKSTVERPPVFGCHGLHEWAMVYRAPAVRYGAVPMRLSAERLAAFVESRVLCCTHFDAFRFFTPAAAPRNRWALDRGSRPDFEQPGCLHANMDLYKWATKAHPWISSGLAVDCLELAIDIRELDMRASPYDLRDFGFDPVCVETPEGREQYETMQRDFTRRAAPLRRRLINQYQEILR